MWKPHEKTQSVTQCDATDPREWIWDPTSINRSQSHVDVFQSPFPSLLKSHSYSRLNSMEIPFPWKLPFPVHISTTIPPPWMAWKLHDDIWNCFHAGNVTVVKCVTNITTNTQTTKNSSLPRWLQIVIMWPTTCGHIMKRCGCLSVRLSVCHVSYLENGAR